MFDTLAGTITVVREKSLTLLVGGVGFKLFVPKAGQCTLQATAQFYIYFHWNAENGPSLYAFETEFDRKVFMLIIDCSKVGPSIALNILSQLSSAQFLEIVTTSNILGLSSVNGIGSKKAEQIIVELKHKVQKLLQAGELNIEQQSNFVEWQHLSEVLISLNYTKQEVVRVTQYLAEKYTNQNCPLDQLIRAALAYLSSKQG
jgi:holliday junction DNA helicase RuvA